MFILVGEFLALSAGAHWYISSLIERELTTSMLATTGKTAENINTWLKTLLIEPETIASTPAAKAINRNFAAVDAQNINRHKILHGKHPDIFQDIYAVNRHGEYHTVRQTGNTYAIFVGHIADRSYFKSIMSGGAAQITPPLISRTTGIPTIFIVAPIQDEHDRPQGLIGAGISLEYVQKLAENLKVYPTGYSMIADSDGLLIYHPDRNFALQKNLNEFEDPSVRELARRMTSSESGMHRYTQDGKKNVAFYQPIPITGWSVATVVSEADFFAPAARMVRSLIIITLAILIVVCIAIVLASRRLTRPLRDLAAHVRKIAAGNLAVEAVNVQSQDEFGQLAANFNDMALQLAKREAAIRSAEAQFRGIFENAIEGIYQATPDGRLLSANPAIAKILGYGSPEKFIAAIKNIKQQLYVRPEERDVFLSSLLAHGDLSDFKTQFYRNDGNIIWVSISARLARDAAGSPLFINGFLSDITDRKNAEEALRRMNEDLETRVRDRTRQLQVEIEEHRQAEEEKIALQEQLLHAQKLEAIGTLAGGLAHDFNNILLVLIGYCTLLQNEMGSENPLKKHLDQISAASERAANITRSLLAFSRKQVMDLKPCQINEIVRSMEKLLKRLVGEDIELRLLLSDEDMSVNADIIQMGQTLLNLAANARDAMPEGGTLTIETRRATMDKEFLQTHGINENGTYAVIVVSDTGCGMNEPEKQKIFEPFFTTKDVGKGIGLGLSIVYGIVKQHRGFTTVASTPGKGTTVHIHLPIERPYTKTEALRPAPEKIHLGKTILVAEDQESLQVYIRELLESEGYSVITAADGEEAVRQYKDSKTFISLLLLDVVMPGKNGMDAYLEIRRIKNDIPVIFMSGHTGDIVFGKQDNEFHFISKPLSPAVLLQKVREMLDALP